MLTRFLLVRAFALCVISATYLVVLGSFYLEVAPAVVVLRVVALFGLAYAAATGVSAVIRLAWREWAVLNGALVTVPDGKALIGPGGEVYVHERHGLTWRLHRFTPYITGNPDGGGNGDDGYVGLLRLRHSWEGVQVVETFYMRPDGRIRRSVNPGHVTTDPATGRTTVELTTGPWWQRLATLHHRTWLDLADIEDLALHVVLATSYTRMVEDPRSRRAAGRLTGPAGGTVHELSGDEFARTKRSPWKTWR